MIVPYTEKSGACHILILQLHNSQPIKEHPIRAAEQLSPFQV